MSPWSALLRNNQGSWIILFYSMEGQVLYEHRDKLSPHWWTIVGDARPLWGAAFLFQLIQEVHAGVYSIFDRKRSIMRNSNFPRRRTPNYIIMNSWAPMHMLSTIMPKGPNVREKRVVGKRKKKYNMLPKNQNVHAHTHHPGLGRPEICSGSICLEGGNTHRWAVLIHSFFFFQDFWTTQHRNSFVASSFLFRAS